MATGKSGSDSPASKKEEKAAQKSDRQSKDDRQSKPSKLSNRRGLRWGIVGLALLVGLIVWIATKDGGDGGKEPAPLSAQPRVVSEDELAEIATALGQPIYWAGGMDGMELEASETAGEGVLVTYASTDSRPPDDPRERLSIGSYPLPDANAALDGFAERESSIVRLADDGRKVVSSLQAPNSVYFASPDGDVQVEVYDPSPARAMDLALSGRVEPLG